MQNTRYGNISAKTGQIYGLAAVPVQAGRVYAVPLFPALKKFCSLRSQNGLRTNLDLRLRLGLTLFPASGKFCALYLQNGFRTKFAQRLRLALIKCSMPQARSNSRSIQVRTTLIISSVYSISPVSNISAAPKTSDRIT